MEALRDGWMLQENVAKHQMIESLPVDGRCLPAVTRHRRAVRAVGPEPPSPDIAPVTDFA